MANQNFLKEWFCDLLIMNPDIIKRVLLEIDDKGDTFVTAEIKNGGISTGLSTPRVETEFLDIKRIIIVEK